MTYHALPPCIVVRSATHIEIELMKLPDRHTEFASDEEEQLGEQTDYRLAERVHELAVAACNDGHAEELVYTNWDWFGSRSRSIVIDERILSRELVAKLAALLHGEHADWFIYLDVQRSLAKVPQELGVAAIFRDKITLERSLHERVDAAA